MPRDARAFQGERAGLVSRGIAASIDLAVVVAVMAVMYAGWAGFLLVVSPRNFTFPDAPVLLSFTAVVIVGTVYLAAGWAITGRSYGQQVMGLRVTGPRGRHLSIFVAMLRALACILVPAGLLWIPISRDNRSVQDLLFGTTVVYDWTVESRAGGHDDADELLDWSRPVELGDTSG